MYIIVNKTIKGVVDPTTVIGVRVIPQAGSEHFIPIHTDNTDYQNEIYNINLASEYEVMSVPTFIFYRDGKQVNRHVGTITEAQLGNFFN